MKADCWGDEVGSTSSPMKSNRTRLGLCGILEILDVRRMALLGGFESLLSEDIEDVASSADLRLTVKVEQTERSCSGDWAESWSACGSGCAPRLVCSVHILVTGVCLHAAAADCAAKQAAGCRSRHYTGKYFNTRQIRRLKDGS